MSSAGDADRPYHEWDCCAPKTQYSLSKLAGEQAIRPKVVNIALFALPGYTVRVVRPSFIPLAKLTRQDGAPLKVVDDQVGNPTSCDVVAELIGDLVGNPFRASFMEVPVGKMRRVGMALLRPLPRSLVANVVVS